MQIEIMERGNDTASLVISHFLAGDARAQEMQWNAWDSAVALALLTCECDVDERAHETRWKWIISTHRLHSHGRIRA